MKAILKQYYPFILCLLVISLFLRFYNLESWFFFNIDEDWFNYIVRGIIVDKDFVLIGWEMPGGLLTAPVAYYLGSFIMIISNHNLLGYAVFASLISSCTVILSFFTAFDLFKSKKIAFFSSLIVCFSYLVIIYSRITLTLYLGPFLALLTYLSLKRIIKDKEYIWFYVLSLVFIFSTQEGSLLSLSALSIITLFYFRKLISFRRAKKPLVLFLAIFIPVLLFDVRHDFLVTKRIIHFFQPKNAVYEGNKGNILESSLLFGRTFSRMFIPTGPSDIHVQILPCEKYTSIINNSTNTSISLIGILLLGLFVIVSFKRDFSQRIISLHIIIGFIGLFAFSLFVPGHLHSWFFVVYFPAFSFIGAYYLVVIWEKIDKILALSILIFIICLNIGYFVFNTNRGGYKNKQEVVAFIKEELAGKPFSVDVIGSKCNGYGYRYLFTHKKAEPAASYMDDSYNGWLYTVSNNQHVEKDVYIVPLDDLDTLDQINQYAKVKKMSEVSKILNSIEVLIVSRENN